MMQQNRNGFLAGFCLYLLVAAATAANAPGQLRWSGVERIVAFGDVHGAYDELTDLLQDAGVIDKDLQWVGGSTHVVSVGDLVDRGAHSRKVLDLLMRLHEEAPATGGYVHVLLGNHEIMNLTGELQDTATEEYAAFADNEPAGVRERARETYIERLGGTAEAFNESRPPGFFGHRQAFSTTGHYGKWLLTLPFMIVINDTVFVHGGLSPLVAQLGLEAVNETLSHDLLQYLDAWNTLVNAQVLVPEDDLGQRPTIASDRITSWELDQTLLEAVDQLEAVNESHLFFGTGPIWYRGTALCYAMHDSQTAQAALDRLGAKRVAVGHTPTPDAVMRTRLRDRAILMDTGMLTEVYQGEPSALIIEGDEIRALYGQTGKQLPIEPDPRRVGWRPKALTDDELEEILRTGRIIAAEEVGEGVTQSTRVTIIKDGITIKALFKSEASDLPAKPRSALTDRPKETDHYRNEVAAYRVDRLIRLDMVPVTVIREHEGKTGSLQFWIDNLVNEIDRTEWGVGGTDWCRLEDQWNLLYVFDALIYNADRTMQNMTYEEPDWMLRLIDHSRSFSTKTGRPLYLKREDLKISDDLRANLAALDYDTLEAELSSLLSSKEIRALLKRRDRMLKD